MANVFILIVQMSCFVYQYLYLSARTFLVGLWRMIFHWQMEIHTPSPQAEIDVSEPKRAYTDKKKFVILSLLGVSDLRDLLAVIAAENSLRG